MNETGTHTNVSSAAGTFFFFSSRRRHTRSLRDWSSDVCSSDLDREHRAQARATLRNFAGEMEANRQATQRNRAYHETLARELIQFLRSSEPPSEDRFSKEVHFEGVRPVIYEHTAWDLALATQALSYLKPDLAFDISKVYTQQNAFQTLENSFLASAFTPASMSSDNVKGLATAMV